MKSQEEQSVRIEKRANHVEQHHHHQPVTLEITLAAPERAPLFSI